MSFISCIKSQVKSSHSLICSLCLDVYLHVFDPSDSVRGTVQCEGPVFPAWFALWFHHLGKSSNLSVPQFLHLKMELILYLRGLL